MSNTDSFIEEVTEEVHREKLYGYFKRYGWIAALAVLLLVGGAAYNEYRKATIRSAAEARGDAILAALAGDDSGARAAALGEIAGGEAAPVIAMLQAAEAQAADDVDGAAAALAAIANDSALPRVYRDLAQLKRAIVIADTAEPDERISVLEPLSAAGGAFRVLAEEQIALAEIAKGDTDAALTRLRALVDDAEASRGLRLRVQQLIVALGGEAEPA